MKRLVWQQKAGVLLLPMMLATGAYGLTASNTMPSVTRAGDGSVSISGYTISAVEYTLNATDPDNIDAVAFTLAAASGTYDAPANLKIKVDADGAWYACDAFDTENDTTASCDTTIGTQATVANADELRVVASD